MPPALIIAVPATLALVQLEGRCALRPLRAGEATLVKARLRAGRLTAGADIVLRGSEGVAVETPAVRIPSRSEAVWRVRPGREGAFTVTVDFLGQEVAKELVAGRGRGFLSAVRTGEGWARLLRHPGEEPIPAGPVAAVEVVYPPRDLALDWRVAFLAVSLAVGYAAARVVTVELP